MNKKEVLLLLKKLIEQSKAVDYNVNHIDPNKLLKLIEEKLNEYK